MAHSYSIGEVAQLSGISVRSLRFYEEAGLLIPARDERNGYRSYTATDIDRLQDILLLRHLGVAVRDIAPLLSTTPAERRAHLAHHLGELKAERDRLERLIETVEKTIEHLEGNTAMEDNEKFEGFKRELVEENEERHGTEARERWGDDAVDASNRKMLNMSEQDYDAWRALDAEILDALGRAVHDNANPAGDEGARICELHRRWLGYTWPAYTPAAHRGLAEMYVADERFSSYYDCAGAGGAAWLHDAIVAHAGV